MTNLFDVSDLVAIEEWREPVLETTDVSLLPDDVYLYGPAWSWCCVFGGKLIAKDVCAGDAYAAFANAATEAKRAIPFNGEPVMVESEE